MWSNSIELRIELRITTTNRNSRIVYLNFDLLSISTLNNQIFHGYSFKRNKIE